MESCPAHSHCQVSKFQGQEIPACSAKAAQGTSLGQDGPDEGCNNCITPLILAPITWLSLGLAPPGLGLLRQRQP